MVNFICNIHILVCYLFSLVTVMNTDLYLQYLFWLGLFVFLQQRSGFPLFSIPYLQGIISLIRFVSQTWRSLTVYVISKCFS